MNCRDGAAVRTTIQACLGLCDIGYPGGWGASGLSSAWIVACPTIFDIDSMSLCCHPVA